MFKNNDEHTQQRMFTAVSSLPESARERLESSWAHTFYHEFFRRIDESVFAVLYSSKASRPNTPVNLLFAFDALKSGFGWSDLELYDHFLFDMQVRYAMGLVVRPWLTARPCNRGCMILMKATLTCGRFTISAGLL